MTTFANYARTATQARTAICVTGWHFWPQLFDTLLALPGCDIYVVSHRPESEIPQALRDRLGPGRILLRPNVGYDWGCYQQFLETGIWRDYAVTVFMHDDIVIKDTGFLDACKALLEEGYGVVGNGRVGARYPYPRQRPDQFAHASWKPPVTFFHDCVRGSFFATTRAALEALETFEVFWDPYHLSMTLGNCSLRASCARWEARLGPRCFTFLSNDYLRSAYIDEDERGGGSLYTNRPLVVDLSIRALLAFYMLAWWRQANNRKARYVVRLLHPLIRRMAGAQT